ncbi:SIR2 family protein [Neptunomonas phycophila]|uniref:SIR2 family protein n=1 Tax=Neptunomonas phycophila TaxID=1572645 RepID=A0AAW7XJW2_9GAMM|nr:SIR2 family protein [Neptunomonas phycophila]MDO6454405.1 SIR2 family protein [Neptunomonas phycophila]
MTKYNLNSIEKTSDYPSFKKLCSAIWQEDKSFHGAAVMIGAGFSRSAANMDEINKKPPLWNNLSNLLMSELGSKSYSDPLRLAEEYSAFFGRQTLNNLLKREIKDQAWTPGYLYEKILKLPWTDILTTNWDTLLERASNDINETFYSIVNKQEDLSYTRPPRIVKLHGTINTSKELIFTQEDYRNYPRKNAAFVNFARQVFIENELCLIGFSGDDPNFLQWIGWVRDQLNSDARKIYLIGALNLSNAKRKYLESLNISPIDLASLVEDYNDDQDLKHKKATEIFLNAVYESRPVPKYKWNPNKNIDWKNNIDDNIKNLKENRENYPGWIVCPNHHKFFIKSNLSIKKDKINELPINKKAELIYELSWFYNKSLVISDLELSNEIISISENKEVSSITKKQQLEIASYILKISKWHKNNKELEEKAIEILQKGKKFWADAEQILLLHKADQEKFNLEFDKLEETLEKITTKSTDLLIKKSFLYNFIGDKNKAINILKSLRSDLAHQYKLNSKSIYILSRLDLIDFILINCGQENINPSLFRIEAQAKNCSITPSIDYLNSRILKDLQDQDEYVGIELKFKPGSFKENKDKIKISNEVHTLLLFEELTSDTGIPILIGMYNILRDSSEKLQRIKSIPFEYLIYISFLTKKNGNNSIYFEKTFSRIEIAKLKEKECEEFVSRLLNAAKYWIRKANNNQNNSSTTFWNISIVLELLSRLSIRSSEEKSKEIYNTTLDWANNKNLNPRLFTQINKLINNSIENISKDKQISLINSYLSFPIPEDIDYSIDHIKPKIYLSNTVKEDRKINILIQKLIQDFHINNNKSIAIIERLWPFIENNLLSQDDKKCLSSKIWQENDLTSIPEIGLLEWAYLKLPSPNHEILKEILSEKFFTIHRNTDIYDSDYLQNLINSIHVEIYPNHEQSEILFNEYIKFDNQKHKKESNIIIKSFQNNDTYTDKCISKIISEILVPNFSSSELNNENFLKIKKFLTLENHESCLSALPFFAKEKEEFENEAFSLINDSLYSKDDIKYSNAAKAITTWSRINQNDKSTILVNNFFEMLKNSHQLPIPALLQSLLEIIEEGFFSDNKLELVTKYLEDTLKLTRYNLNNHTDKELVIISLVRAKIFKLANLINEVLPVNNITNKILLELQDDPLPEVRLALER